MKKLVEKAGQAWDNDPRVAYVEMGIIGEFGEHHDPDITTVWAPHDQPNHVENRTWLPGIEKVLGDAFTAAFKNKKVMVRYAYEFKDYEFGIYWDSWAIDEEKVRGYEEMKKLGDRWKTQPIGGEITWNWGSLYKFKSFEEVVQMKRQETWSSSKYVICIATTWEASPGLTLTTRLLSQTLNYCKRQWGTVLFYPISVTQQVSSRMSRSKYHLT